MEYGSIDELATSVAEELEGLCCGLIYAPNSTGKTRLAQHLKDADPASVLLYNAIHEDTFAWDNDRYVLTMSTDSELLKSVATQGLDGAIVETFQVFTRGKIEPTIDLESGEVTFGIHTGDDSSSDGIKISRAEENLFVWCVYFSVLGEVVEVLGDSPDLRSTNQYDDIRLAVIDDPVSSMDDERIVAVALAIADLIKRASGINLKFLISTHHALFFNVLYNALGGGRKKMHRAYILGKGAGIGWTLTCQPKDSPFSYHLEIIREIGEAISDGAVRRVHFNQFRTLLEKTSNFLGYTGGWGELVTGPDKAVLTRVLNLYSHDRLSELDYAEVPQDHVEAFTAEFQRFMKSFGWAKNRDE